MGETITVYLTNNEMENLRELCEFYGEQSQSRVVKLAIVKLHKSKIQRDTVEVGKDVDLEALKS